MPCHSWIAAVTVAACLTFAAPAWAADPVAGAVAQKISREGVKDRKTLGAAIPDASNKKEKKDLTSPRVKRGLDLRKRCEDGDRKACTLIERHEESMKRKKDFIAKAAAK